MGILRTDRVSGLGGADAIKGSVKFTSGGALDIDLDGTSIGTSNFTIEAWVFWFGNGSHQFTGSSSNNFNFYIADDDGDLKFYNGSSTYDFDASPVRANEWTHVALVREGTSTSKTKVYVNGVNTNTVTLNTSFSFDRLLSGINYLDGSRGYGNGYTSNLRFTLDAVYTSAFTPPNREFTVLDNTIVLCCQSPGNILQEATGKTIVVFKHGVNQGDPVASHFTPNSPVGFSTTTDVGTQFGSTFDGVTTFDSQAYMVPPGGNTRERNRGRAAVGGGYDGSSVRNEIEYFNIQSMGTVIDFGNLTATTFGQKSNAASSTRGIIAVGGRTPTYVNTIEFITIATTSNATDFGDISSTLSNVAASSNQTRGVTFGGRNSTNVMEFITIATVGNASDFGDLTLAKRQGASVSSPTRGVYAGGFDDTNRINNIEFITIASAGNASDFGDLTVIRQEPAGASDNTRGVFAGGYDTTPSATRYNTIDFITIASAGNATDFGDTPTARADATGTSNNTRGVFAGFNDGGNTNLMAFVTIQTTGNASDFGDLITKRSGASNCSDSHGGLS
jgi:hypothetical protein